jgi:hypothetical protein
MKITKFGIHIKAKDVNKSKDFYLKFGFEPVFAYGKPEWLGSLKAINPKMGTAPENYDGVTFDAGSSLLEIANGHSAVRPEVFQAEISNSKISAMIHVDSVSDVVRICEENQFKISVPIKEYPWGTKEVVIKDPDGFVLVFIESLKK